MSTLILISKKGLGMIMRMFKLYRHSDQTGISGIGYVAEGVEFSDGCCVLRWTTATKSTSLYASMTDLLAIHGHGTATVPMYDPHYPGHDGGIDDDCDPD